MTKHIYFLYLFLFISSSTAAIAEPLKIVASIKPIHSLVAGITQGVSEPELLISSNQSPHHYSLRPSDRRMLAEADLIFWIGTGLESFLPSILDSLDNNKSVSLIKSQGLKLLAMRSAGHDHENEQHQKDSTIDAHIWLNTHNVDILVDTITEQIILIDPDHKQQYQSNNKKLHEQIAQLRKSLEQSLSTVKRPFLTYHDGYQYFETEFGLSNVGYITASELQPGARRISELKQLIKNQNIQCVFYDAPRKPPVLNALLSSSSANSFMLDPVGVLIPSGQDAWFNIMHSLNQQFLNCQQSL